MQHLIAVFAFLGEDPWVRLRELKKACPKTPLQMLLRGQNLLGYRHYADDVVERFVERCVANGMDVFRVFDALNDPRNMKAALQAVRKFGGHAQGTLSYTTSPVHTMQTWLDTTEQLLEIGIDSLVGGQRHVRYFKSNGGGRLSTRNQKTFRRRITFTLPLHHWYGRNGVIKSD